MKNTFGNNITVTLFGESHGPAIGAVLDGIAPGLTVDPEFIKAQLLLRAPSGKISTPRVEADKFQILSGVFEGKTTGTPLTIIIPNENTKSKDYSKTKDLMRPGHADFTANEKYHGFQDYRGGGHFSGRITAGVVAVGAIAISALREKGIYIATQISSCAGVVDDPMDCSVAQAKELADKAFPVVNDEAGNKMVAAILDAAKDQDSVGGVLKTVVTGMPAGVGEPWFDSMESMLSHAMFSIPAVKGVEFGDGFAFANERGSFANDAFEMADGSVQTKTNHNGGINGGITNGMPIVFSTVIKPTPSIAKAQDTINYQTKENSTISIEGRHDPAIVHRARAVVNAMTALTILDMLTTRFGTDWIAQK